MTVTRDTPAKDDMSAVDRASNDDQQAIEKYFQSDRYRFRSEAAGIPSGKPESPPNSGSRLEMLVMGDRDLLPVASYCLGMVGISFMLLVTAAAMPLILDSIDRWIANATFVETMLVTQAVICPPLVCFSFVTVTPMFWYGSVSFRFLTAAMAVLPGCIAFYLSLSWLEGIPNNEFWVGFIAVMFADFVATAAVALTIQMWTPWTLTHERADDSPLPVLGTRALLELTAVSAVGCAIVFAFDTRDVLEGILFFAGVGLFSSAAIIGVLVAFLRSERSHWAMGVALFFTYVTTFLFCSVFAAGGFGYDAVLYNVLTISAVSFFGMLVVGMSFGLNLWWLHLCGWRCVRQR